MPNIDIPLDASPTQARALVESAARAMRVWDGQRNRALTDEEVAMTVEMTMLDIERQQARKA